VGCREQGPASRELKAGEVARFEVTFTCDLGRGSHAVTYALTFDQLHVTGNYE